MKLTMKKHPHGFYIWNKTITVNVPERFMKNDPFQETFRFLYLLGFEMEREPDE